MKMPDAIDERLFAPCGMDCMVCYVHLRKKKPCGGCLGPDDDKPDRCRACAIKLCASGRGYGYCHECPEFPCARIKSLDRSYRKRYATSLVANGLSARYVGLAAFMEKERGLWRCGVCGGVVSLHDGTCSECGAGGAGRRRR